VRIVAGLLCALLAPVYASAQAPSVFGGYEWAHPDFENVHLFTGHMNGWKAGAVVPVTAGFGVVGQVDGVYGEAFGTGIVVRRTGTARPWFYDFEGGPRYTVGPSGRASPFVEGLIGVTHGQVGTMGIDFLGTAIDTRFEGAVSGGIVVQLTHTLGVQGDASYRRSRLFDQRLNRVQIGATAVWRIGGR
jgi:outer membrane protein with beta-barrel domain